MILAHYKIEYIGIRYIGYHVSWSTANRLRKMGCKHSTGSFRYATLAAELIFQVGRSGLLPLVTLTEGGKRPEVVQSMIDCLVSEQKYDLLVIAEILDGLSKMMGINSYYFCSLDPEERG